MTARVLVIDDDLDHAESIADVLTLRGYEVALSLSGEDGVARFRAEHFDLAFIDVKLPGINGVATFFELRKIKPDAKVMLMTGFSLEQLIAQAVDNGALGVLRKPFAIDDLLAALDGARTESVVLVADDDADFVASMEPLLSARGYRVQVARTGGEALDQAALDGIDCLILDLAMPVLSGLEVFLKLRAAGKDIPTIFVTGRPEDTGAAMAQIEKMTSQGILMKPFNPAELLQAVDAATGGPDTRRGHG